MFIMHHLRRDFNVNARHTTTQRSHAEIWISTYNENWLLFLDIVSHVKDAIARSLNIIVGSLLPSIYDFDDNNFFLCFFIASGMLKRLVKSENIFNDRRSEAIV